MKYGHGRVNSTNSKAQHTFAAVPTVDIPRSQFNRSHGYKTTFNEGYLVPIFVDEALPGDTFNCRLTAFARMSTPIDPIMDNLYMDSFFFFVPNRLIWTHWVNFNGQQTNPADSTNYVIPTVTAASGVANGSLFDYMGVPTQINGISFNALYGRAYNLIWNEWFRDQNLQNSLTVQTDDGPDTYANYTLQRRGKRHDYFTSCLPWPQKVTDGTTLNVPLSGSAPVCYNSTTGSDNFFQVTNKNDSTSHYMLLAGTPPDWLQAGTAHTTGKPLFADLSAATGVTINQLRQSFQIQRMFEKDARGGTRYTEIIKSHFGVISPDARLQRPEYLGGGSSPININPVAQTSATSITGGTTPLGNLAAFATCSLHNHGFTKSFTEHGVIIGLVSVRADLNYQQGLSKIFSRSTRYDYYWPSLAHIGEQAVLNKEIYMQGTADDNLVFGYQERYAEYRYKPGLITGQFRSNYSAPLDSWHLAQAFGSLPTLNTTFIQENAPMTRVLASATAPHFLFDGYFDLKCARPMPVYSVPGLIDHF